MNLKVAGIIFLIVAILHLVRFICKTDVTIGKKAIPMWTSIVGFIVALFLSAWMLVGESYDTCLDKTINCKTNDCAGIIAARCSKKYR